MDENKNVSNMETDEFAGESLHDSVKVLSPMRLVFKRFFRSRLSIVGLTIIVLLFLFSFVGRCLSPMRRTRRFISNAPSRCPPARPSPARTGRRTSCTT